MKMNIDYQDRSTFKAVQKTWEVLQVLWEGYLISPNAKTVCLLKQNLLIKGRNEALIDSIIDTFKRESCFRLWNKNDYNYVIEEIDQSNLSKKYSQTKDLYKKLAEIQNSKQTTPPSSVNQLMIQKNGDVRYDVQGRTYRAKFRILSNSYRLLVYLAHNSDDISYSRVLVKELKRERLGGEGTPERRVRDTIQSIRKKLKITNPNDDLFTVNDNQYGLKNCAVNFVK